jgi:formamidopyrimidine-DNA glycosylase
MLFGRQRLEPSDATREPNLQLALTLDDAADLRLIDRLGYARAALLPNAELDSRLGLDTLGPEVLAPDFPPEVLGARLARKRIPIKPALLDQHVVAGRGNRDADESLWRAGIDPRRPAGSLADDELQRLTAAIVKCWPRASLTAAPCPTSGASAARRWTIGVSMNVRVSHVPAAADQSRARD